MTNNTRHETFLVNTRIADVQNNNNNNTGHELKPIRQLIWRLLKKTFTLTIDSKLLITEQVRNNSSVQYCLCIIYNPAVLKKENKKLLTCFLLIMFTVKKKQATSVLLTLS